MGNRPDFKEGEYVRLIDPNNSMLGKGMLVGDIFLISRVSQNSASSGKYVLYGVSDRGHTTCGAFCSRFERVLRTNEQVMADRRKQLENGR